MQKNIRVLVMIILGVIFALSSSRAFADETVQTGSISLRPTYNKEPVVGGDMLIYQVAIINSENKFQLLPIYQEVDFSLTTENLAEINREYAQGLASLASADQPIVIVEKIGSEGIQLSDLSKGLYLFVQKRSAEGYELLQPFLVSLPFNGSYTIEATEKMSPVKPKQQTVTPTPPSKRSGVLPYTGQLWWPVYLLIGLGVVLFALSFLKRSKQP